MEKVKKFFKAVGGWCKKYLLMVVAIVLSVVRIVVEIIRMKKSPQGENETMYEKAYKAKEETYEKIKNTSADELVAGSECQDDIRRRKDELADEAINRIAERLQQELGKPIEFDEDDLPF